MKTFIDSDGVLADFIGWVESVRPGSLGDDEAVDRCVVDNYTRAYLDSKPLHEAGLFLEQLAVDPDCYVLTCVGDWHRYKVYYPEKTDEEMVEIFNVLRENKYKWFEEHGVPRDKVVIVEKSSKKLEYCAPGFILVDDWDRTVDAWNDLGGVGIKVYHMHKDF